MLLRVFYYILGVAIIQIRADPLNPAQQELIFPSGSTFQLSCLSHGSVDWYLPLRPDIKGEHYDLVNRTIVETARVQRSRRASNNITITVTNATYLDTGAYVCAQGYNVLAHFQVFIEDDRHLVLSNNETISVEYEEPDKLTIPCLPTHPSVSVELLERKSTMLHLPTGWTYDRYRGFTSEGDIRVKYYERWLECHAIRNVSAGPKQIQQSVSGVLGNAAEEITIRIVPKGLAPSVRIARDESEGSRPFVYKLEDLFELPFHVASFSGILNISVFVRECPPPSFGICNSTWDKLYHVELSDDTQLSTQVVRTYTEVSQNEENVTYSKIKSRDTDIQVYSVYINGVANVPRNYMCIACNQRNCSKPDSRVTIVLGISDLEDGISLEATSQSPYTTDVVNITCAISLFYFRPPITWKYNGLQINPPGASIATASTFVYAERLSITFYSSYLYRDNKYSCSGVPLDESHANSKIFKIEWKAPVAPTIYHRAPEDKIIEIDGNFTQLVKLKCYGAGDPHPDMYWKMDNDVLTSDSFSAVGNTTTLTLHRATISKPANYTCVFSNRFGEASETFEVLTTGISEEESTSLALYAGLSAFIVLVAVVAIVLLCWACRRKLRKNEPSLMQEECVKFDTGDPSALNPELSIDQQADLLPYDPKWEFPRNRLTLGRLLGAGAFGRVYQAEAVGISDSEPVTVVAVKTVKTRSEAALKSLIAELKIMIHLGSHLNILNLLGACTRDLNKGELFIIVEYCRYGNLRSYLFAYSGSFTDETIPQNKKHAELSSSDLLCWAYQIARGMVYLAERKVIHGDLAARNIFLTEEKIVKVGDFGLARNVFASGYYKKKANDPLPLKWMAPEALLKRKFTSQSDVWSYGIVLWELFTLGTTPYPGLEPTESLIRKIAHGYRLEKPPYAPLPVYDIMLKCWKHDPNKRPSFLSLEELISNHLEESVRGHYVELNAPYVEMNQVRRGEGTDYLSMLNSPAHLRRVNHRNYANDPVETDGSLSYYDRLRVDATTDAQYLKMTPRTDGNGCSDDNSCIAVPTSVPSVRYTKY